MHARIAIDRNLISPEEDELTALLDILRILEDVPDELVHIDVLNGTSVRLPASAVHALRHIIDAMAHDAPVAVTQVGRRLMLSQVAELLNLPLSHVTRIVDSGELPAIRDDGVTSVAFDDLLAFIHARAVQRRDALNELTRLSEELGLYDLEE
jgi:excisionase family DNA binding protein